LKSLSFKPDFIDDLSQKHSFFSRNSGQKKLKSSNCVKSAVKKGCLFFKDICLLETQRQLVGWLVVTAVRIKTT